jgi:hypothetical protein
MVLSDRSIKKWTHHLLPSWVSGNLVVKRVKPMILLMSVTLNPFNHPFERLPDFQKVRI